MSTFIFYDFSFSDIAKPHLTSRKVPNAFIASENDGGIDQGDRADNEEEDSDGTDVSDAEDDICLTVSANTKTSPCNYHPSEIELTRHDVKVEGHA